MSDSSVPVKVLETSQLRRSRRIPIIWAIPVLAIAIGGWLAWDTLSKQVTQYRHIVPRRRGPPDWPIAAQVQRYNLRHGQEPRLPAGPPQRAGQDCDHQAGRADAD
jgi:hypothetical protein